MIIGRAGAEEGQELRFSCRCRLVPVARPRSSAGACQHGSRINAVMIARRCPTDVTEGQGGVQPHVTSQADAPTPVSPEWAGAEPSHRVDSGPSDRSGSVESWARPLPRATPLSVRSEGGWCRPHANARDDQHHYKAASLTVAALSNWRWIPPLPARRVGAAAHWGHNAAAADRASQRWSLMAPTFQRRAASSTTLSSCSSNKNNNAGSNIDSSSSRSNT